MDSPASVSVVIPAFNAQQYLGAAIDSVLSQNYIPLEIIIVDDGSSDATVAVARSFGSSVIVISQANKGPASARNTGIKASHGEYIGFLDADDVYKTGSIHLQIRKLQENRLLDVVLGRNIREKLVSGPGEPPVFKTMEMEEGRVSNALGVGFYRKRVFERVGLFEESLRHCEDWDWFARARELGVTMLLHDEVVLLQRLHYTNLTRDVEAGKHYLSLFIKRSIDRRRSLQGQVQPLPDFEKFREKPQ